MCVCGGGGGEYNPAESSNWEATLKADFKTNISGEKNAHLIGIMIKGLIYQEVI